MATVVQRKRTFAGDMRRVVVTLTMKFDSDVGGRVDWSTLRPAAGPLTMVSLTAEVVEGGVVVAAGQCVDEVRKTGYEDAEKICDLWEQWHLNDMRPGCVHQAAAGWSTRPIDPAKPARSYGKFYEGQTSPSWNLLGWVRREEHPEGLLCRPCPECGYEYGTAWLYEPVPEEVVKELGRLFPGGGK